MTTLVKEVEQQCRKQKGVVIINTLQPTEKRDKLVALLTGEVKKVTDRLKFLSLCGTNDTIKPIIYNSSFLFRNQQIRIFSETPTTQKVKDITYVIIFFTLDPTEDRLNISNEARIISTPQWNDASVLDGQFKAFQLDLLFKIIIDHSLIPSPLSTSSLLSPTPITPTSSFEELRRAGSIIRKQQQQQQQNNQLTMKKSMENMDISSSKDDSIAMDYDVRSSNSMDESVVTTSPLKKKISYRISFSDVAFTDIMDGGNKKHASNSRYAQLVLDHTFSRQFKNNDIFDEYIRYMEYCPWYSHSKSVIGFLYDMIIHTKNDHTKMNKIFEKVLETELFINTKSLNSDSDNILTLYGFVYSIVTIRPLWFDYYRISPDFDQFWVDVGNNHFRIKADWILKFPDYHNRRLPIINGFIDLEENDFVTLFLPVFYRCLLTDLYNYLIYIEGYHTNFTNEIIAIEFMERFEPDTDTVDFFATFPLDNSLPNYYDFSVAYGFPTKTAEDASIKLSTDEYNRTLYKLSLSRSSVSTTSTSSSLSLSNTSKNITTTTTTTTPPVLSSSSTTYQQAIQNFERSNMPDLEDLINPKLNYLPKCLSNLMTENGEKRKKMKYHDRLNLTTYLADMDYGKEEIVQAFPDDANSIAANFTTYKRKREKDGDKKFNTFYCTAIMNKSPDNRDDHCRCPYIENTDYTKRLSSSSSTVNEDQFTTYKRYRDSCYSNIISKGSFSHPLNYVSIQVNK